MTIIDIQTSDYCLLQNENVVGGEWLTGIFAGVFIASVLWYAVLCNCSLKKVNNSNSELCL